MAFQTTLPSGEKLLLENQNGQTLLTFSSQSAGQQQSQRTGFQSGEWTHPPTLFQAHDGVILRVEAEKNYYLALDGHALRHLDAAPDLRDAHALTLERAESSPKVPAMKPMEPMKPLKPMEPMKPMEMRKGSMQMSMGDPPSLSAPMNFSSTSKESAPSRAQFCTQCGAAAQENDRFCAKCGNELRVL